MLKLPPIALSLLGCSTVLAWLLSLGIGFGWMRSYSLSDVVSIDLTSQHLVRIKSLHGTLHLISVTGGHAHEFGWAVFPREDSLLSHQWLGFGESQAGVSVWDGESRTQDWRILQLPFWFPTIVSVGIAGLLSRRLFRWLSLRRIVRSRGFDVTRRVISEQT